MKKIKKLLSLVLSMLLIMSTMQTSVAAICENLLIVSQQMTVGNNLAYNNTTEQLNSNVIAGDTNNDGLVDIQDYQVLVNTILKDDHKQIETASYDDIIRYDLNSDGYLDALDAYLMLQIINGFATVEVYEIGDYDCNGIAYEESDLIAIKHAISRPYKLTTAEKRASDINGDGKVSEEDLTNLIAIYGEIADVECKNNAKAYYSWKNNYKTCTATALCSICNVQVEVETINTTSETLSELTCTEDGRVKYTATFSSEFFGTKATEVVTNAKGHNWSEWKTEIPATALSAGKEKRICSACANEEDRIIDKLNLDNRIVAYYTVVGNKVINLVDGKEMENAVVDNSAEEKAE